MHAIEKIMAKAFGKRNVKAGKLLRSGLIWQESMIFTPQIDENDYIEIDLEHGVLIVPDKNNRLILQRCLIT